MSVIEEYQYKNNLMKRWSNLYLKGTPLTNTDVNVHQRVLRGVVRIFKRRFEGQNGAKILEGELKKTAESLILQVNERYLARGQH